MQHVHTDTCMHSCMHACTHAPHIHVHIYACMHAHTHMHTHTCTHTHSRGEGQYWLVKYLEQKNVFVFWRKRQQHNAWHLEGGWSRCEDQSMRKSESNELCGWSIGVWACICLMKSGESWTGCDIALIKDHPWFETAFAWWSQSQGGAKRRLPQCWC